MFTVTETAEAEKRIGAKAASRTRARERNCRTISARRIIRAKAWGIRKTSTTAMGTKPASRAGTLRIRRSSTGRMSFSTRPLLAAPAENRKLTKNTQKVSDRGKVKTWAGERPLHMQNISNKTAEATVRSTAPVIHQRTTMAKLPARRLCLGSNPRGCSRAMAAKIPILQRIAAIFPGDRRGSFISLIGFPTLLFVPSRERGASFSISIP